MKKKQAIQTAKQQGYQAFVEGQDQAINPFTSHTPEWFDWNEGYEQAFVDMENELYGNQ